MAIVVIFANSVKHGKHCVAGKIVGSNRWVRPVSNEHGAELSNKECQYQNNYGKYIVKPLQKIEMEFARSVPLIHQPENYLISGALWVQKYKIEPEELVNYLDNPDSLWGTLRSVRYDHIQSGHHEIQQSLYLVRVEDLNLHIGDRNQRRASFTYNDSQYDLPVTDPNFEAARDSNDLKQILCVSLGEPFTPPGRDDTACYKIVATIF